MSSRHLLSPKERLTTEDLADIRARSLPAPDSMAHASEIEKNLSQLRTLGAIDFPKPGHVALTRYVMP